MPLADIARSLDVSPSTIRRDMELLEGQGVVRRTHGGVVYVGEAARGPGDSGANQSREKQAIARATAELIPAGGTLMINGGSTCLAVARAIQGRRLNVVTNSVGVAALLSADLATEVTLIGGYVYPRIGVAVGEMAVAQAAGLHATQFVTSCAGVTGGAAFEPNQMMVAIERQMMKSAEEVVLIVDHTKLNQRAVVQLCELSDIDIIVTDAGAAPEARAWLGSLNTKVIFAEV